MKIYIIRHGETNGNKQGYFQGWLDEPLNDAGEELAIETGKAIKGLKFDVCFSSPLSRAKKTAELVLKYSNNNCPIIIDDRLKEINAGDFENKSLVNVERIEDKKMIHDFFANPKEVPAFPNGESVNDVIERSKEALIEISKKNYESVLISTHGCALRCMLNHLYENPNDFWQGHVPYNCSISIVDVNNNELKLIESDKIFYNEELLKDHYKKYN